MLDSFRKERDGSVPWMGTAKDAEEVRAIFKKLHVASPGVYFTLDRSTQTMRTNVRALNHPICLIYHSRQPHLR